MSKTSSIVAHYRGRDLLERLKDALIEDGVDPTSPTLAALAPYDHFHSRGIEATSDLADKVAIDTDDHILDLGAGMGGPARYVADRFGCRVTGIDLTQEFCDLAHDLSKLLNLEDKVAVRLGDVLVMPFEDASFDGAYSMNVSMNIEDKAAFYKEIMRVLKPGGWLVLSEIAKGPGGELDYPTPWAKTAESSFLATPEATSEGLKAAGFTDIRVRDTISENREFSARSREMVERGLKPPHRAVALVHGEIAAEASANSGRGLKTGATVPIEVTCVKP